MQLSGRLGLLLAAAAAVSAAPAAADIGAGPSSRAQYRVVTIGDSYASGEGEPDVHGQYDDEGDLTGEFEDWDTRFGGSPREPGLNQDSTRCHRSGHTSPSAVATQLLQQEFPDVFVSWRSVACSGASIVQAGKIDGSIEANGGGLLRRYDGVENLGRRGIPREALSPAVYRSQIEQIESETIDALVMSAGGNDAAFGDIIAFCANIIPFKGPCQEDNDVTGFIPNGLSRLNSRFDRLSAALRGNGQRGAGDPRLRRRPAAVFIQAPPNPLRPSANTFCDRTPPGDFEENVTAAESRFLTDRVAQPLVDVMRREARQHGWTLVDDHLDDFVGHAICTPAPDNWINTNIEGLRKQGELDETEGLPIAVSAGIVHPNRAGHASIGQALHTDMRPAVLGHFTPGATPRTTTLSREAGFAISLSDANLPPLASGYWHRVRLDSLNDDGTISQVEGDDSLRDLGYGTLTRDYPRTGRYFVIARACGPLSRDGTIGCGPQTVNVRVSTFVPKPPENFELISGAELGLLTSNGFTIKWEHADVFTRHDTRRWQVRLRTGRRTEIRTVEGATSRTVIRGLNSQVEYGISIRACNDGNRCSAFTAERRGRPSLGQRRNPPPGADVEIVAEGVPCSRAPVPFDPNAPQGSRDGFPAFMPTCPDDPEVGNGRLTRRELTTRPGRPAPVQLDWTHPRRRQDLHEVLVELEGRRGVLATLRFDLDAGTIALTPRRGGARRLGAGRTGTLRAGGVEVRIGDRPVVPRGSDGRSVRLRFGVVPQRSAGDRVGLAAGAVDDSGIVRPPEPVGSIRVRR